MTILVIMGLVEMSGVSRVVVALTVVGAGVVAFFLGRRKPKSTVTKILGAIIGAFATLSGLLLALLVHASWPQVELTLRLIGLLVGLAGLRLLLKIVKP